MINQSGRAANCASKQQLPNHRPFGPIGPRFVSLAPVGAPWLLVASGPLPTRSIERPRDQWAGRKREQSVAGAQACGAPGLQYVGAQMARLQMLIC